MKQANHFLASILMILCFQCINPTNVFCQAEDISFEKVKEKCKGIPRDSRVRLTVTRFSVSSRAAQATGQFGEELTAIMTNAIQQSNCFLVLESTKNQGDLNDEIGFNETGATQGNGPKRGKQLGAQAIVTAEITEYNEGKSNVTVIGMSVGGNKAKIGLIVKVIDPETRVVLWSKSVNGEAKKSGFNGFSIFGINMAGSNKMSEALSSAVEDVVLRTVDILVKEKDEIFSGVTTNGSNNKPQSWNAQNCGMLQSGDIPKIMVILPEYYLNAPILNAGGETEIIRKLLESGFKVVDPSMYATIRNGAKFSEAVKNPMAAVSLGKEFGADIVIFGEAICQRVSTEKNVVTCRANLEGKAVKTSDAEIIATNSAQAGGQDIAESASAKTALKNAGSQLADYLIEQFCSKQMSTLQGKGSNPGSRTEINVEKVDFGKLNSIANTLKSNPKIKDVQKQLKGGNGTITIMHEGSTDDIAEFINSKLAAQFEITGVEAGKISLSTK